VGTIPAGKTQYISYITRVATSNINKQTAVQANYDSGGTFTKVADGEYTYTFAGKAPANFDKAATHSIGIWAARDLSEFDMQGIANYDSDVYNFVPNGAAVTVVRDVIRTQTCNKCHDPLSAHDERQSVELCNICHTPQTTDPDTGNTVDMKVMIHKIHAGSSLPSVKAGGKYQIIGYRDTVADYSDVVFPADVRRCTFCHEQNTGAAQATAYLKPSMAACGSCHDTVNFATGLNHVSLPQVSDNNCAGCHIPENPDGLEFEASIKGAHTIPTFSNKLPGTVFKVLDVIDGVAGKRPTVAFSVKDRAGNAFDISGIRLSLVLAGPTKDYSSYVSEAANKAQGPGGGTYFWTFQNPIPANATGSWSVGMEGYRSVVIYPGTPQQQTVRDAGINNVYTFPVDGSKVQPRRQIVSLDKCNSCHAFLSLHGGNRNQIEQCVLCHNPNTTDTTNRPKTELPTQTVQMAYMIHRIHTGEEGTTPYIVYGNGGSKNDFGDIAYVGDRRNCNACHVNGSENPPLDKGQLPVVSPRGLLNPMGPTTAACIGCHTSVAAASHALTQTSDKLGEACGACHSTEDEFSVSKIHAR